MKRFALLALIIFVIVGCYVPTVLPAPTETALPTVLPTVTALPTLTPAPNANSWKTRVTLPTVNVRDQPDGAIIGSVTVGSVVEIVGCVGNWCQIVEPAGYIWRGCLEDNPENLGCRSR